MKILLIALLFSSQIFAQNTAAKLPTLGVSYVTPNKDTLFLQNDEMGHIIKKVWLSDKTYNGYPKIIFVDDILLLIENRKKQKNY
jgi:hypothetical protein